VASLPPSPQSRRPRKKLPNLLLKRKRRKVKKRLKKRPKKRPKKRSSS
jgi:hypothetical protein